MNESLNAAAVPGLLARLNAGGRAVLIRVTATEGSAPRDAGAWMAVWEGSLSGNAATTATTATIATIATIGGGRLELDAIEHARKLLLAPDAAGNLNGGTPVAASRRFVLGPQLGQCCGGVVELSFEIVGAADALRLGAELDGGRIPLALFGGGHVGRALVEVLGRLPFAITWIDSRGEIFPSTVPARVQCEHSEPVHLAVRALPGGTRVLIMSFSHAEDLDIVAACLKRQRERGDLPYIGLIGSRTKWATFRHRLQARGFTEAELSHVTCPIGIPGIEGKEPEVIAIAVAAQLLQTRPVD